VCQGIDEYTLGELCAAKITAVVTPIPGPQPTTARIFSSDKDMVLSSVGFGLSKNRLVFAPFEFITKSTHGTALLISYNSVPVTNHAHPRQADILPFASKLVACRASNV
jgi:hypothetical protein